MSPLENSQDILLDPHPRLHGRKADCRKRPTLAETTAKITMPERSCGINQTIMDWLRLLTL